MQRLRVLSAGIIGAVVLAGLVASAAGAGRTSVVGSGLADVTDVDGNLFPAAGRFSLTGGIMPGGSAYGRISFVFRGAFAGYWGALPGVTDVLRLSGAIDDVRTDGTSVILAGTLTEVDTAAGAGVVFVEENVPFEIITEVGSNSFVLQFCLLPAFLINVSGGQIDVQTSGPSAVAEMVSHTRAAAGGCSGRTPVP